MRSWQIAIRSKRTTGLELIRLLSACVRAVRENALVTAISIRGIAVAGRKCCPAVAHAVSMICGFAVISALINAVPISPLLTGDTGPAGTWAAP